MSQQFDFGIDESAPTNINASNTEFTEGVNLDDIQYQLGVILEVTPGPGAPTAGWFDVILQSAISESSTSAAEWHDVQTLASGNPGAGGTGINAEDVYTYQIAVPVEQKVRLKLVGDSIDNDGWDVLPRWGGTSSMTPNT